MKLYPDYKTNGLIVEVPEPELHRQAQELCAMHTEQDLFHKEISHITYMLPIDKKKQIRRVWKWSLLMGLWWGSSLIIFALGILKLIELIAMLWV